MLLLVVYALIVWFGAMRLRRRVAGFAIAVAGGLIAMFIGRSIPSLSFAREDAVGMQWLIYGEAILVTGIGLFIASLPRPPKYPHCAYCRYDLRGLQGEVNTCPECGQPFAGHEGLTPTGTQARLNEIEEDKREAQRTRDVSQTSPSPPTDQVRRADEEHGQRHDGDDTPLNGGHLPR